LGRYSTYGSESYIPTDGESASLFGDKAPIWGLRPDFYYCQTFADFLMLGAVSDERTGLSFIIAAGFASTVIFGSESHGNCDHILLSQIRDFPFRSLLRLAGLRWRYSTPPPHGIVLRLAGHVFKYKFEADRVQNTAPNSVSTLVFVIVAAQTVL
jgi:hypothetical protein